MNKGGTKNKNLIPDGFSYFDARKMSEYNEIRSIKPRFNLFEKVKPTEPGNDYGVILTRAEIDFYDRLKLLNIKFDVINANWLLGNDIRMLGREWELKTISRKTNTIIKNVIWKITDQGKRNAIIDTTFLNRKLEWIFSKIEQHLNLERKGEYRDDGSKLKNYDLLDSLIVVRANKLIRYK